MPNPGHPLILTLDMQGAPHRWVTWQHACFYYAKNLVAWVAGDHSFTFHGGTCRETGERSSITVDSIIAIKGKALAPRARSAVPPLNNRELFHRDRHTCAYCGHEYSFLRLTRDHIQPVSQGGRDLWMNVVTACRHCNQRKSGRTPEQVITPTLRYIVFPLSPSKRLLRRRVNEDRRSWTAKHPRRITGDGYNCSLGVCGRQP